MLGASPPQGLEPAAWATAAVAVLMAIWWFSEAVPIAFTGALPFLLLPLLGVASPAAVASKYMSPVLFLVLGGAMLGLALEKWGLHRRVALAVTARSSPEPRRLLLALMAVTALVSMWVNNSATTVMMLPIAGAIVLAVTRNAPAESLTRDQRRFAAAMVLSVALASNIGGFATPIGTPVNPVAIGIIEQRFGVRITFVEWLAFGVPLAALALPVAWWILTRVSLAFRLPPASRADIAAAIGPVGPLSAAEGRLLAVIGLTSAAWVLLPLLERLVPGLTDAGIAVAAALALCVIPAGGRAPDARGRCLLEWEDARRAPWYLILLLGGGLALADSVVGTGLGGWLGEALRALAGQPLPVLLLLVAALCILVTECASNLATAATFMPIAAALALAGGHDPLALSLAAGIAASWGFANPAGTSSNAMVIGTGRVSVREMIRTGVLLDLAGALLIALACLLIVPRLAP